jgi:hypothetical protein
VVLQTKKGRKDSSCPSSKKIRWPLVVPLHCPKNEEESAILVFRKELPYCIYISGDIPDKDETDDIDGLR